MRWGSSTTSPVVGILSIQYLVDEKTNMQDRECQARGWVDKAQCFRSARWFDAVGSSPDFSRVFSQHLASRHLNLSSSSPVLLCRTQADSSHFKGFGPDQFDLAVSQHSIQGVKPGFLQPQIVSTIRVSLWSVRCYWIELTCDVALSQPCPCFFMGQFYKQAYQQKKNAHVDNILTKTKIWRGIFRCW